MMAELEYRGFQLTTRTMYLTDLDEWEAVVMVRAPGGSAEIHTVSETYRNREAAEARAVAFGRALVDEQIAP